MQLLVILNVQMEGSVPVLRNVHARWAGQEKLAVNVSNDVHMHVSNTVIIIIFS